MDRLRKKAREVGDFVRSAGRASAVDTAEIEKLQEFENRIRNFGTELKDLKHYYQHNLTHRLHTLTGIQDILQDFQQITSSFGDHFTMESVLTAWIGQYTKLIRLLDRIVDSGSAKDNLKSYKGRVENCARTLMMFLLVRYDVIGLARSFLELTHKCNKNQFDMHIFCKAKTTGDLLKENVEQLSELLLEMGVDIMDDILAVDLFNTLVEHSDEVSMDKMPNLYLLKGRLMMVIPVDSIMVKSAKHPYEFDLFPHVKCIRI